MKKSPLALHGGSKAIPERDEKLFHWPIVTREDIAAVTKVLRQGSMSGTEITKEFEKAYAQWNETQYALGTCNGTAAVAAAIWACGVGAGDEVICPTLTYWASCAAVYTFGATVNFADVDPRSLCIDPGDIEHRIGAKTKAIIVVHYAGMPADMDAIMAIARKHRLKVIEDNSHGQGSIYKGRKCGSIGDIAAASLMSGKCFAIGEAGIITTSNRELYERCVAFGHYERTGAPTRFNPVDQQISNQDLLPFSGMPIGAVKHRMNQTCAAMGLVQIKHQDRRVAEINRAMNYFADLLDHIPCFKVVRPAPDSGLSKGGWYFPFTRYFSEQADGVSAELFAQALTAEGIPCGAGANKPLHLHNFFHHVDIFNQGKPTAIAFHQRDVRQGPGSLPVAEATVNSVIWLPWFKKFNKKAIQAYGDTYQKVYDNVKYLKK